MNKAPLLLGGTGRCGTTILGKMISTHKSVTSIPETRFLVDPGGVYDFVRSMDSWTPYSADQAVRRLRKVLVDSATQNGFGKLLSTIESKFPALISNRLSPRYASLNVESFSPHFKKNIDSFFTDLVSIKFDMTWVGQQQFHPKSLQYVNQDRHVIREKVKVFLGNYFEDVCRFQEVEYYFEKNTWNILHLETIAELWPDFKLVCVHRNPYEVIRSFSRQSWMPSDEVESAKVYVDLMNRYQELKSRYADSILEVKFEDLADQPDKILENIFNFYGIDAADQRWQQISFNKDKITKTVDRTFSSSLSSVDGLETIIDMLGYAE